jgi:hypothetical protein
LTELLCRAPVLNPLVAGKAQFRAPQSGFQLSHFGFSTSFEVVISGGRRQRDPSSRFVRLSPDRRVHKPTFLTPDLLVAHFFSVKPPLFEAKHAAAAGSYQSFHIRLRLVGPATPDCCPVFLGSRTPPPKDYPGFSTSQIKQINALGLIYL